MYVWEKYERDAAEIADAYEVSPASVYTLLRAYCIQSGLIYENYLRFPHKQHKKRVFKVTIRKENVQVNLKKKRPVRSIGIVTKNTIVEDLDFLLELVKNTDSDEIDILIEATQLLTTLIENILKG